ncbi:cell division-specific peptidoglycan biosynthesis regulator FtsW [Pseudoxanthomonas sp. 3HH-4]|uniref:putative lipid II flippase FtsW n=1 Tax=Pseudoxanthomonas sp. 3HH-4 TaxID=1690214 RepID=UPI00114EC876|nr:putative lipid II flippase FtsW [Pseudoxanthomonas sp. 3HH-4]TQM06759.1 cell division-specific peptidoglycan biosynthesis regulator FtsW [Pseudoxanthomonas sp. 3HH-4]
MNDTPRQATRLEAIGGRFDPWLLGAMLALASLGVVMVASASIYQHGNPFYYLVRHGMFLVAGAGLAWWVTRTELKSIEARNHLLLLGCMVLLLLVFVPGLGVSVKGAHRWINLGVSNFQVVEAVKVFFIVWLASYLVRFRDEVNATWAAMLKPLGVVVVLVALLLMQPDFGSSSLLLAITAGMLVLGGVNMPRMFGPVLVGLPILAVIAIAEPYRMRRLTSFSDPWADPFGSGYQLTNALMAIGRGEWGGIGLGGSVLKLNYLPEVHTDFIFSVIGEELGFVGVCLVVALYALLVGRAFVIGLRCVEMRRHFAGYIAFGVALWIGMQSFVSMGVNLGLLPTKGLTLPLISSGGSSILMTCVAMGLLLRVSYELERTQRQVALRGEVIQGAGDSPASVDPRPVPAATASFPQTLRGTSRLQQRVEPTFERIA